MDLLTHEDVERNIEEWEKQADYNFIEYIQDDKDEQDITADDPKDFGKTLSDNLSLPVTPLKKALPKLKTPNVQDLKSLSLCLTETVNDNVAFREIYDYNGAHNIVDDIGEDEKEEFFKKWSYERTNYSPDTDYKITIGTMKHFLRSPTSESNHSNSKNNSTSPSQPISPSQHKEAVHESVYEQKNESPSVGSCSSSSSQSLPSTVYIKSSTDTSFDESDDCDLLEEPVAKRQKFESNVEQNYCFTYPSPIFLKQIWDKLGVEYTQNSYKLWRDDIISKDIQNIKSPNIYAILSTLFTGDSKYCFIIQHHVQTALYEDLISSAKMPKIEKTFAENVVTDKHLKCIAEFLSCSIEICENGILKKSGKWENNEFILVLSFVDGKYSVLFNLKAVEQEI